MKCNKKCYWNYNGECCPEDKEGFDKANPLENEKCDTYLRPDFEDKLWETYDDIIELIKHRKLSELEEIKEFIINQRNK
jgi:hypothetical protein